MAIPENEEIHHNSQESLDSKLNELKALSLDDNVVSVYLLRVKPSNKNKRFQKVDLISCTNLLKDQFKGYVQSSIGELSHISELRDINTNQDNRTFYVEKGATDFDQAVKRINDGDSGSLNSRDDLAQYNGYVIQLTNETTRKSLYAFRYFKAAWSLKNTAKKTLILSHDLIASADESPRFEITSGIDLLQFDDDVFVTNISSFESAMNYKERLLDKKIEATEALHSSNTMSETNTKILSTTIGTDKHFMRQLASVFDKGFYADPIWVGKLKQAAESAGDWLINFTEDGKITMIDDKNYVRELLTLLQNKRVKTVVDGVVQDVDGELIALEVRGN